MKRLLSLILVFALFVTACTKPEPDNPQPNPETPKQESVTLSPSSNAAPVMATEGGSTSVSFTASTSWSASIINTKADSWCSVVPTSGVAGAASITITAKENTTPDNRSASVVIKAGTATQTIKVEQKQKDALTVTASSFEISADGREIKVATKANVSFTHTISTDAQSWIKAVQTKALKDSTLTFEIAANDNLANRSGQIYLASGDLKDTVNVYQAGETPTIVVSKDEYILKSEGESFEVEVASNVNATMSMVFPQGVDTWISENTTRTVSTNKFYFAAHANETYISRSALIIFSNAETNLSDTVTVSQAQKDAIVVAKSSYNVENEGGTVEIEIGHNVDYEYTISADWITKAETKAFETDKLVFNVAENTSYDNREGKITFTAGDLKQEVKVYQFEKGAIIINKKDHVIGDAGGEITLEIQANVEFSVTEPTVEWLHNVTTKGLHTHTLKYTVDPNESYDSRSTQLYVKNLKNGTQDTLTVTQTQKDAIVVAKSSYNVEKSGGTIEIEVGHNVDYEYTISADWITKAETKAFETDKLVFNVAENTSYDNREGKITFTAGDLKQEVKVYQSEEEALIINKKNHIIDHEGGEIIIEIKPNIEFSVSDPTEQWLIKTLEYENKIHYLVFKNTGYSSRTTQILVKDMVKGTQDTLTITQLQKDAIVLAKSEYEYGMRGGKLDLMILSNVDMNIAVSANATNWIKQINTRALDTTMLHFDIAASDENQEREGTITISGGNAQQIIKISQRNVAYINIPDSTFKAYCLEKFDANNDGEITTNEASNILKIDILSDDIETLEGIEFFENLESLSAYPKHDGSMAMGVGGGVDTGEWRDSGYYLNETRVTGKIKTLDVSKNLKLKRLDCSGNLIKSLDLSNNTLLEYIDASFNVDLDDIKLAQSNSKIKEIRLIATSIKEIDLTHFTDLERLEINRGLGLQSLDISSNTKLKYIDIARNSLSNINVRNNPMLEFLDCCMTPVSSIDISNNPELAHLNIAFSNVSSINLSNNLKLNWLWFQNANVSEIDISMLTELQNLNFGNYRKASDGSIVCNDIKNIDLSKNTKLEELWASLLDLENIDLSNNTKSKRIFIEFNLFEEVDVSYSPDLHELSAYMNPNLSTIYITPEQQFTYSIDSHTKFAYKDEGESLYESSDYSKDGEVKQLQTATKGDGIDIILMGDAYSDRLISNGTYDSTMNVAMKKFFEVEPYKSFREYFNVYSVTAVSENEVYSMVSSTALSGYFGEGTLVGGNDSRAFEYAKKAVGEENMDEALVVVMMNSTLHAGTCWMYYPSDGDWGNGVSVSYFPVGADSESLGRLIHHEAAGHGFAKLGDEYAYEDMGTIPELEIGSAQYTTQYGWLKNIDFTNDPSQIKWKHFLNDSRYANEGLGIYEGAYTYWKGVWRPTVNSIMNTNTGGFNAPSREAIYYRINKLAYGAEWEYDYEDFVEWDAANRNVSASTRGIPYRVDIQDDFQPTHPPMIIRHSWREAKNNAPEKRMTRSASNNAGSNLRKADASKAQMVNKHASVSYTRTSSDGSMVRTTVSESGRIQQTVIK